MATTGAGMKEEVRQRQAGHEAKAIHELSPVLARRRMQGRSLSLCHFSIHPFYFFS
jgi:hypothetical protein